MIQKRLKAPRGKPEGIAADASQAWRLEHSGRLLLQNYTSYEKQTLAAMHAACFAGLKHLHLNVFRHLDVDGTRMAELAKRLHVTKASMTALIGQCEKDGYVTVQVDALDARARVVRFSAKGQRLMASFRRAARVLEQEMEAILGARSYQAFREALTRLRDEFNVATLKRMEARSS